MNWKTILYLVSPSYFKESRETYKHYREEFSVVASDIHQNVLNYGDLNNKLIFLSWKRNTKRQLMVTSQVDHHGKQHHSAFSWPSLEWGFELHSKNGCSNSLGSKMRTEWEKAKVVQEGNILQILFNSSSSFKTQNFTVSSC